MRFIAWCIVSSMAALGAEMQAAPAPYFAAGLPSDAPTQPAAANCATLRSGVYRMVSPTLGGTMVDQTGRATLDAATLTITRADGTQGRWEDKGNCRFGDPGVNGYSVDYVVSRSGILVGRIAVNGGSSFRNVVGFPEQIHAVRELAGVWNLMAMRRGADSFYPDAGHIAFDDRGRVVAAVECSRPDHWAVDACAVVPTRDVGEIAPYVADPAGGFVSRSGAATRRLFLYRVSIGQPMLVGIEGNGAFFVGTVREAMEMPPVGMSTRSWNLDMTDQLASATSTYSISSMTVATDVQHQSWTRRKRNIGLPDEHLENMWANKPRIGYFFRPAGEAATSDENAPQRTIRYNEFTQMTLPGMAFGVLILPAVKLFEFSLLQP